jgi:3-hydroxyacyl-[acyl-carrier-protein] dehydratase
LLPHVSTQTVSNKRMTTPLEYEQISRLLPYRPPMLLIDRVLDWSAHEITVEKTVLAADPLIEAHMVHGPKVVPGVLLIELVGQGAYLHQLLCTPVVPFPHELPIRLLGRCKGRFIRLAHAGDLIRAEIVWVGSALNGAVHRGRLLVGSELIAEVEVISAVIPPRGPVPTRAGEHTR